MPHITLQGEKSHDALRMAHEAMHTTFEIFFLHEDQQYAKQAVYEIFQELDKLEQAFSRFISNSDISRINALRQNETIRIGLDTFECLKQSKRLLSMTKGAFNINVGAWINYWRDRQDDISSDSNTQNRTKQSMEWDFLKLDEKNVTVTALSKSRSLDLGGIGKGYAIDHIARLLREWDIESALIHGGTSTALALDAPPAEKGWPITISHPNNPSKIMKKIDLENRALSGSGLQKGQHIIDPRTGKPVTGRLAAWAFTPDATSSDALSTAFMIMSTEEIRTFCMNYPDTQAVVVLKDEDENNRILEFGDWE
ncbi:FAD:protein FMN transferase [bacterium]|nr:FAD:protein FMN transferase [bacterium]RQV95256.1 MAG: FAD:protein FMN transferase [bacterium]